MDEVSEQPKVVVATIRVDDIRFHPSNIRRDLGDLRTLTESIRRYGVMQPIVVERAGGGFRLRAGHRRTAAARLAGIRTIPALVHREVLDDDEFVMQALHENTMRRGLTDEERREALQALRDAGCTLAGIAENLGVTPVTISRWLAPLDERHRRPPRPKILAASVQRVVESWREKASAGLTAAEAQQLLDELTGLGAA